MGRRPRVFVEGGVYHVYCRTAHGERAFEDQGEAAAFVEVVREIKERDGFLLYAWSLMANHYHLALRSTRVSLWRSMASINVRVTKGYNRRKELLGPLWQTRYRAKIVMDQRYLERLILYIHLNPVAAGLVEDPSDYPWSGHLELMGKRRHRLVDIDEALLSFGTRRAMARRAYSERLAASQGAEWTLGDPGELPWWRRRGKEEDEIEPREDVPYLDYLGRSTAPERPVLGAGVYLERACTALGVDLEEIAGRGKTSRLREARELLAVVGVERYHQGVRKLAEALHKNPGSVSRWVTDGAARMKHDDRFERAAAALDTTLRERA
ncbi:MAG: transposase [Acidobacteria bacterium]|nr:transposase [Acidobacteriota bacterium]